MFRGPVAGNSPLPVRQLFQDILRAFDQFRPLLDQAVGAAACATVDVSRNGNTSRPCSSA